jgi:hypothetical protein
MGPGTFNGVTIAAKPTADRSHTVFNHVWCIVAAAGFGRSTGLRRRKQTTRQYQLVKYSLTVLRQQVAASQEVIHRVYLDARLRSAQVQKSRKKNPEVNRALIMFYKSLISVLMLSIDVEGGWEDEMLKDEGLPRIAVG